MDSVKELLVMPQLSLQVDFCNVFYLILFPVVLLLLVFGELDFLHDMLSPGSSSSYLTSSKSSCFCEEPNIQVTKVLTSILE